MLTSMANDGSPTIVICAVRSSSSAGLCPLRHESYRAAAQQFPTLLAHLMSSFPGRVGQANWSQSYPFTSSSSSSLSSLSPSYPSSSHESFTGMITSASSDTMRHGHGVFQKKTGGLHRRLGRGWQRQTSTAHRPFPRLTDPYFTLH